MRQHGPPSRGEAGDERSEAGPSGATRPFLGLTGAIGAGKSEALAAFGRLGCSTLSTDAVVHELYSDPEVVAAIDARWGEGIVGDRSRVAEKAFATSEDRAWLEGLLWPRVGERVYAFHQRGEGRAMVVEVPLLFESGLDRGYAATIAIVADEDTRAARAGARDHAELAAREARQLSQDEKAARATYVVRNDGSISDLEARLSELLAKLGV